MKRELIIVAFFVGITSMASAQFWKHSDPVKIGGTVNTEAEESIPVFSKDSSILYFVRMGVDENKGGEEDQDIWYSRRDENGDYIDCARLTDLNNKFNNAVAGLSKDGSTIYVLHAYDGKKDVEKGIATAKGGGTNWSQPEEIEIPGLVIEGDFYGFHINEAEDAIIISYAGLGSLGEEDLYVSTKTADSWSNPVHMGNEINSVGFEISPFLSKSGDTLFFSSNGFGGQGDADVFYSVKKGGWTEWSTPINLGAVINSPKFDAYFIHSGSQAYWSSNRDSERSDIFMMDIYTPPLLLASCTGTDASVYQGADGKIDLVLEGGVPPFKYAWSNGSSEEDASGLVKGEYSVTISDAVGQTAISSCSIDEPAMPLDPVTVVEYENFSFMHNFSYNKNKISPSKGNLKKFVKDIEDQLKKGRKNITINITSSASNVPTKTFGTNEKLAQTRAENIKYDLMGHFEKKDAYKGKVNVVIVSVKVDGPQYEDDSANDEKYYPFQFVSLKTE